MDGIRNESRLQGFVPSNFSDNSLTDDEVSMEYMWTLAFSIIMIISICGNTLVLWIVLAHRRMRSVTNYFLVNLALADVGMATLNCIPSFIYMRDGQWIFGSLYCSINLFTSSLTVSVSVFTLLALTLERYKAIMTPLAPRKSHKTLLVGITLIWTIGTLVALPAALFSGVHKIQSDITGNMIYSCILIFPDGLPGASRIDYVYNLFFFLCTYILPLACMAICYVRMGKNLWRETPGELTESTVKCRKNKRKVVKMFVVIISVFGICWLPYHVYFLYSYHKPEIMKSPNIKNIYLAFYWLAMANCAVNPIIYYWMGNRFRKYFNQLMCLKCIRNSSNEHERDNVPLNTLPTVNPSPQSRRSCTVYLSPELSVKSQSTQKVQNKIVIQSENGMSQMQERDLQSV